MDIPAPLQIRAPYVKSRHNDDTDEVDYCDISFLAPHLTFSNLHSKYPAEFDANLGGGLPQFWSQVRNPQREKQKGHKNRETCFFATFATNTARYGKYMQ